MSGSVCLRAVRGGGASLHSLLACLLLVHATASPVFLLLCLLDFCRVSFTVVVFHPLHNGREFPLGCCPRFPLVLLCVCVCVCVCACVCAFRFEREQKMQSTVARTRWQLHNDNNSSRRGFPCSPSIAFRNFTSRWKFSQPSKPQSKTASEG
jgi:hypothetical protein